MADTMTPMPQRRERDDDGGAFDGETYWKERAIKAELALSGKTNFDEVAAAIAADRAKIKERIERRKQAAEMWPILDSNRELVIAEYDWFLSWLSSEENQTKEPKV